MYPFIRLFKEMIIHRNAPAMPLDGTHVSHHICWPWDLDLWNELNNGRTLTLYDLGRMPAARRVGLLKTLMQQKWGMTMAGVTVRYRRRVRMFDRLEMRTRFVGADKRFIYIDQTMWKKGECSSQAVYRVAVTGPDGIVPTEKLIEAMGAEKLPDLPGWIQTWIEAEAQRPWPPAR
ncbi:acyl-CoA thioesterase [Actibacterium lipolyticum]|uniref:Thioesterase superfamily protein n=1 Tax=Actibacterium lipolyticum TaxID=1524263 RepID=A0A238KVL5_9RHOB|nr:acyl-CoA thioesterase [Actibacterium lipolyticum]SMX46680.1 Thioesterase superfamily protein [Actibacterium lipolyticum]